MGLNFWKPPPFEFNLNVPLEAGVFKELGYIKNQGNYIYQILGTISDTPFLGFITEIPSFPHRVSSITGHFDFPLIYGSFSIYNEITNLLLIQNFLGFLNAQQGIFRGIYMEYFNVPSITQWGTNIYFSGLQEGFIISHQNSQTQNFSFFYVRFPPPMVDYPIFEVDYLSSPPTLKINKASGLNPFPEVDFYLTDNGLIFKEPSASNSLSQILNNGEYENLINGNGIILRDAGGSSYPAGTRWRLKVVDGVLTLEQLT